ncbi:hypothetical protein NLK61_14385 [Pseudomonas fuscovaginae UPB0736]|uniref:hypothetical protein n=1 Tax=Pseudomonas asplenii TaxID=53407 RepID=UPI0012F96912|nr:hypothetical protein [Pseudomonas fuscovaginae]UUQ67764.1 hypothetical protein NLK61_14385 [Pseudomonas fuscovaginae UPB0736]
MGNSTNTQAKILFAELDKMSIKLEEQASNLKESGLYDLSNATLKEAKKLREAISRLRRIDWESA